MKHAQQGDVTTFSVTSLFSGELQLSKQQSEEAQTRKFL